MYKLVDAVNQQVAHTVKPVDLLVLTKFAELVPNPYNPVMRVGTKRFEAMTHIKESTGTLTDSLDRLEKMGLLVPSEPGEARRKKRVGNKPCKYVLKLPEGYNEKVVDSRRGHYYGGSPYYLDEGEDITMSSLKAGDELPSVKNSLPTEKITETAVKITPINISTTKENINGNESINNIFSLIVLCTGDSFGAVAKTYSGLITDPAMIEAVKKGISAAEKGRAKKLEADPTFKFKNWPGYVRKAIEQRIKEWLPPLEPNHDAPQSASKTALDQYELAAEKTKAEIKKQAEDAQIVENIQAENDRKQQEYFAKKMPEVAKWPSVLELLEDKQKSYLKAFKTMFSARWDYDDWITAFETELKAAGNVKIIEFTRDFASKSKKLVFDFPDPA